MTRRPRKESSGRRAKNDRAANARRVRWPGFVLGAVLLVGVLLAGSGAIRWARERPAYTFDPLRLALLGKNPAWLEPPLARAFYAGYGQIAGEPFSLLDRRALEAYLERVRAFPWIEHADARLGLPDRVRLDLTLRRPVAAVSDGSVLRLIGRDGVVLDLLPPDASVSIDPMAFLESASDQAVVPAPFGLTWLVGLAPLGIDRDAARAGAALVREWSEQVDPAVRRVLGAVTPPLVAIDVSNHGLRRATESAEYRLVLRDAKDRPVLVSWGHAPGGVYRLRIPLEQKIAILVACMREHPGLADVAALDVRFPDSWRERVQLATSEVR
ncbi:MAG: hypothetical protein KDC95_06890 [Planctomycetes bacterium]|nr:hypothetical protein [Planctomycetota bacterium]